MRTLRGLAVVVVSALTVAIALVAPGAAQSKRLVYWTHWEQNPEFNKWYETKGKEFTKTSGYDVEVVTIPYQGYEAKYLATLVGGGYFRCAQALDFERRGPLRVVDRSSRVT